METSVVDILKLRGLTIPTQNAMAELMMSNLDAGGALGDGHRTGWRRSTDADDGEAACGILNCLLYVLAEPVISNLDAGEALRDRSKTRWQRSTDANDGKEAAGGILNRLLHALAEVTHLGGLGIWAIGQSCVRLSVS